MPKSAVKNKEKVKTQKRKELEQELLETVIDNALESSSNAEEKELQRSFW